ncbi:hypothetical protein BCV71DRAFT_14950 [Rhizopus microsporus]|uniref:Uncharacterized protein n=1 Tax=Rhizopus microsporus TaxID=58291 RepID=A0A1X0RXA7_RHIZD|nr:hypothetical protein BCV71DRAFT_14950 [Rhizopus microsporus]
MRKVGTDALKGITCKYPNVSRKTMERVRVYSVHAIQKPMTLIKILFKKCKKKLESCRIVIQLYCYWSLKKENS